MNSSLWIDFANSLARDPLGHGKPDERLEDPAWLAKFIARCEARSLGALNQAARTRLTALRTLLLEATASLIERGELEPASLKAINRYLAASPVKSRIESSTTADGGPAKPPYRLRIQLAARGIDALLFAIAASFAEFLSEADSTRLRLCENPDCRWVFYDTTRSRTRRWCADSCGNLIKVRRFRARGGDASAPG